MDIVWHKGQAPHKMELADNGDFDRSANMDYTWVRCNLSHFEVDACVAGKITDKFPGEVVADYVEITLYYAEYDDAIFCCSYTPDGLQCVHISTEFLVAYGGIVIAPRNEEGMKTFVEMLMADLSENGLFTQVRDKQSITPADEPSADAE
ncbi:hypothetical protein [Alistipes timonensis]